LACVSEPIALLLCEVADVVLTAVLCALQLIAGGGGGDAGKYKGGNAMTGSERSGGGGSG